MKLRSAVLFISFILLLPSASTIATGRLNGTSSTVSSRLSPSFLLLSNWKNSTLYIYTGIQDSYLGINGSAAIGNIFDNGSMVPLNFTISSGNTSREAYLSLNNTVHLLQNTSEEEIIFPPYSSSFGIMQDSNSTLTDTVRLYTPNYTIEGETLFLSIPRFSVTAFNATLSVNRNEGEVTLTFPPGSSYVLFTEGWLGTETASRLLSEDRQNVNAWISEGRSSTVPPSLQKEFRMSLLLVKDDQNPYNGEFAASPSPIYMYAWLRDGSFSAMSLQDDGHFGSALSYWHWMASESMNGTWYTRYNFWNGTADVSWAYPEYDSLGLFQIGIYQLYTLTGKRNYVLPFLPTLNRSIAWEEKQIHSTGLIPEDLSIWEDVMAYNFWTQAMDYIGMRDAARLYSMLGLPSSGIMQNATILNATLQKDFYSAGIYAEYALPESDGTLFPIPIADSSTILPIALSFISPTSSKAEGIVGRIVRNLTRDGGLARFYGDTYHYGSSLGDSSGPMPPWIITTLFLAYYDESTGNYTGALTEMQWAAARTQHGLLPEAADPNTGLPLPTTSPLTWSSAMFVITALNYRSTRHVSGGVYTAYAIGAILFVAAVFYFVRRRRSL